MEELQANTAVCFTPETSNYQESENGQIRVTTTMEMEHSALDLGDGGNIRHLYNDTVRQIARSYTPS
jgi:hypothetical protein